MLYVLNLFVQHYRSNIGEDADLLVNNKNQIIHEGIIHLAFSLHEHRLDHPLERSDLFAPLHELHFSASSACFLLSISLASEDLSIEKYRGSTARTATNTKSSLASPPVLAVTGPSSKAGGNDRLFIVLRYWHFKDNSYGDISII